MNTVSRAQYSHRLSLVYVCIGVVLCTYSSCDGLIPRPRRPTKYLKRSTISEVNSELEQVVGLKP
jgi:hypothetical protein